MPAHTRFHQRRPVGPRLELRLRDADGEAWRLSLSPGTERFIGRYPRVPGIGSEDALLAFWTVSAAR